MLPLNQHSTDLHRTPAPTDEGLPDITGKSIYLAETPAYDLHRSMLYALGAHSVSNKMLAHVNVILHGRPAPPKAAKTKYPAAEFHRSSRVLTQFLREVTSFSGFIRALQRSGFTVRNPSDEGSPEFDHFELPLVDDSLHATLLHYLATTPFVRDFADHGDRSHRNTVDPAYVEFPLPGSGLKGHILWHPGAWGRVSAQRGEGDYPLEIKGPDLLAVGPVFWTHSTGLYFNEHPDVDSVNGLFIQAGIDAHSGLVNGAAISRVWT